MGDHGGGIYVPMGAHLWLIASPLSYEMIDAASDAMHKNKRVTA